MAIDADHYTEALRDEIISVATALADKKELEAKTLRGIANDARYSQISRMKNKIAVYAGTAEANFLEGKQLFCLAETGKKPPAYDYRKMGESDTFPCSLSYDGDVWEFYLPPAASVKNGNMAVNVGRWSGYLAKNLLKTHEEKYGKIEMLKEPVLVFEFGFCRDNPLSQLYDADNRDNKRIIDALTGMLIPDDNILAIQTVHYGVFSDTDYTRVYIMEDAFYLEWNAGNYHRKKKLRTM